MDNTPHILIVDDDREIRDLLSRFLTRNGCRVSVAREEREMRKVLQDASIDLIVLDAMLPGKDGFTICRELRATGGVPIIMLTAIGDETDRIVGLEMGADDYVAKPFNPRELLARMRAVLRRAGARKRSPADCCDSPAGRSTSDGGACCRRKARSSRCRPASSTCCSRSPSDHNAR
jgi:two-component system OmpR family response regulator